MPTTPSVKKTEEAQDRLAAVVRSIASLPECKRRLYDLKMETHGSERPDFLWLSIVESFSSWGGAGGYRRLFGNPENYERLKYEALSQLSPVAMRPEILEVLRNAGVRFPARKAEYLEENVTRVRRLGGVAAAKAKLDSLPTRDAKIAYMKEFKGISDKIARNIFMNVYHPDFRQSIAIDARVRSITKELGLKFKSYGAEEQFYLNVARQIGVEGWELDRLMFNFKDSVLSGLRANLREAQ